MEKLISILSFNPGNITASTVAVNRQSWPSRSFNKYKKDEHLELMRINRLNIFPIKLGYSPVTEYYKTVAPDDFEHVERHTIHYNDLIPAEPGIREVIGRFAADNRTFYFLCSGQDISGFITLGNLNRRQVQVYIFSLICELEQRLGRFLNANLTNLAIRKWMQEASVSQTSDNSYGSILTHYDNLVSNDLENHLTEHLVLEGFFTIIGEKQLYERLGYSEGDWKRLSRVGELRKRIANPALSLIDQDHDVATLHTRLYQIEELGYRLGVWGR